MCCAARCPGALDWLTAQPQGDVGGTPYRRADEVRSPVTIPSTELKRLFARSGNRCAFSDCRRVLVVEGPPGEQPVILGDVAHIVAASPAGPRGDPFMAPPNRNRYENLIVLCSTHHQLIDDQVATYTPERLRAVKADHERWIEDRLAQGKPERPAAVEQREDELYSTLLPIDRMPSRVFSAPARFKRNRRRRHSSLH